MSAGERRELARMLAKLDYPHPLLDLTPGRQRWPGRGRLLVALFFTICCVVLVAWIVVLVLTLHRHFTASHWRLAWVGFDIVELVGFALIAWAFWRGRQIVIAFLLITGTLLCCDAWFDVMLDLGTSGMWLSVASAVIIELPLAFLMLNAARHLIRISALAAVGAGGNRLPLPPLLWKLPLASIPVIGDVAAGGKHPEAGAGDPERKAGTERGATGREA